MNYYASLSASVSDLFSVTTDIFMDNLYNTSCGSVAFESSLKSSRRLKKCLDNFQKIAISIALERFMDSYSVLDIFANFMSQGHTVKSALLLTKMRIRGNISPYLREHSYEFCIASSSDELKEQAFLKKEFKNIPHYRDIEFKNKKKYRW